MTQNLDKVNQGTKCWFCKNENWLINCEQLLNKGFIEKKESVNKGRLCFNYLPKGHVLKECKTNFFCRIEGWKKKHQTLLYEETQANVNVSSAKHNLSVTYLQVLQIYLSNGNVSVEVDTLLDSGWDCTLVTKTLCWKIETWM